jgi:hypothetical protein
MRWLLVSSAESGRVEFRNRHVAKVTRTFTEKSVLRCHPERGRFSADAQFASRMNQRDEGPAVLLLPQSSTSLTHSACAAPPACVVIPNPAAPFADGGEGSAVPLPHSSPPNFNGHDRAARVVLPCHNSLDEVRECVVLTGRRILTEDSSRLRRADRIQYLRSLPAFIRIAVGKDILQRGYCRIADLD